MTEFPRKIEPVLYDTEAWARREAWRMYPILIGALTLFAVIVGIAIGNANGDRLDGVRLVETGVTARCFEDEVIVWSGDQHDLCVPIDDLIGTMAP